MITVIGLGPGDVDSLTRRAWRVLSEAGEVYLRTSHHPCVPDLPEAPAYHSFDALYEEADDFDALYDTIAARVLELGARPEGVFYAVPGHPLMGEATVTRILAQTGDVTIISGLSFLEPALAALKLDGMEGLQIHDAATIAAMHHPPLNPDMPALLPQLYSRAVASDVKLTLMNQYDEEHPVTLVHGAGTDEAIIERVKLYEIDRSAHIGHLTTLYVPPLPFAGSVEAFQETVARLRAPDGCPWDRKQTHESLRTNVLEETYEVLEAIEAGDAVALREELGDLLLQIVLHSQIAVDEGEFHMADVLRSINEKIIRRHPHVWGNVEVNGDDAQVIVNWEALKREERERKGQNHRSMLDGVPKALPALTQSQNYHGRAARVGFDWPDLPPVIEKFYEELEELEKAETDEEIAHEMGDVLASLVNWARWIGIDAESALREANARFYRRFTYIERNAGRPLNEMTVDEMDALWEAAKAEGL
jgi:tetrapyrrole methylase family protein/MazG family protein